MSDSEPNPMDYCVLRCPECIRYGVCQMRMDDWMRWQLDAAGAPTTRPVTDAPASLLQGGDE